MNQGQEAEFAAFVVAAGDRLFRTALLLTRDRGHAEDLMQVVLERTARRWSRIDGSPEAYARAVLANAANDRWRRRHARVTEVYGTTNDVPTADPSSTVVNRASLVAALARLTPRQRALLVLRYFDDLTEADIAATLGISVGAVKSGISRALTRLRDVVPDDMTEEAHP